MGEKGDPLIDWNVTTLWFKLGIKAKKPILELNVWHPPDCLDKERLELLAKHAAQGVEVIRQFTESKDMIIQGQYKNEPKDDAAVSRNARERQRA